MSDEDLGFRFQESKGSYVIRHQGRVATTLRGRKAEEFSLDVAELSFAEQQQLMARLTGNYKRGNERTARSHPRNRR